MGDHRWQGYSHEQLYEMLHSGPGGSAAGPVADRWSAMSGALADIQQEINAGVTGSGATWVGSAGDAARGVLGPLGEWAQQAASAADVMRISTDLQADLLGKARAAMPVPMPAPVPPSPLARLFGAQVDYETAELVQQIGQEQAYQVMAEYEAATDDNTSTLGDFGEPPQLVVDASPITGVAVRAPVSEPEVAGSPPRLSGVPESMSPAGRSGSRPGESARVEPEPARQYTVDEVSTSAPADDAPPSPSPTPPTAPTSSTSLTSPSSAAPGSRPEVAPGTGRIGLGRVGTSAAGGGTGTSAAGSGTGTSAAHGGNVRPSARGVAEGGNTSTSAASPAVTPAGRARRTGSDSAGQSTGPQNGRFAGGALVPAARRPDGEDEPDEVHESKYLIEADDIYGRQTYSPPVIGESPRRR